VETLIGVLVWLLLIYGAVRLVRGRRSGGSPAASTGVDTDRIRRGGPRDGRDLGDPAAGSIPERPLTPAEREEVQRRADGAFIDGMLIGAWYLRDRVGPDRDEDHTDPDHDLVALDGEHSDVLGTADVDGSGGVDADELEEDLYLDELAAGAAYGGLGAADGSEDDGLDDPYDLDGYDEDDLDDFEDLTDFEDW
jgi:hypothetical protein